MLKMKYISILGCGLFIILITGIIWFRTQGPTPPAVIVPHFATPTPSALFPSPTDGFGLYEDCSPSKGEVCFEQLAQMARSGFKLVMNYSQLSGTIDEQLRYAYQAKQLGMKIIWNFADPRFIDGVSDMRAAFPALAQTCGCSDNTGFITYVINQVKYLPATWGYYVGDEVTVSKYNQVKALSDLIHETDNHHPRLLVMRSITPAVNPGMAIFADTADVLAQDFYPIGHYQYLGSIGTERHANTVDYAPEALRRPLKIESKPVTHTG